MTQQQPVAIETAGGPRRGAAVGVLLALALTAGAGWYGWQRHLEPADAAQSAMDAAAARAASAASEAASASAPEQPISIRLATPARRTGSGADASLRWPLWEFQLRQPIPPRDPPLTPPSWRLIGATSSGGARSLVILRQGRTEPEYFRTGDTLPGGYVVGEITDEDVTLVHGKKSVLLSYIGTR